MKYSFMNFKIPCRNDTSFRTYYFEQSLWKKEILKHIKALKTLSKLVNDI